MASERALERVAPLLHGMVQSGHAWTEVLELTATCLGSLVERRLYPADITILLTFIRTYFLASNLLQWYNVYHPMGLQLKDSRYLLRAFDYLMVPLDMVEMLHHWLLSQYLRPLFPTLEPFVLKEDIPPDVREALTPMLNKYTGLLEKTIAIQMQITSISREDAIRLTLHINTSFVGDYRESIAAAATGLTHRIGILHQSGRYRTSDASKYAARYGHLNCLRTLKSCGYPLDPMAAVEAAQYDHVECLKYLHENDCEITLSVYYAVARFGSLACLRYLCENNNPNYLSLSNMCEASAKYGQVDCLRYLWERNRPDTDDQQLALMSHAVTDGHLNCVRYLRENDSPCYWNQQASSWAAANNQIECLRYMHEAVPPCPIHTSTPQEAARCGNIEILKYLHSIAFPWDIESLDVAVESQQINCVRFLMDHAPPDLDQFHYSEILRAAAGNGFLEGLRYLHEKWTQGDCPWNESAYLAACENGEFECLKYLHENGCPKSNDAVNIAASGGTSGHIKCVYYLHAQMEPGVEHTYRLDDERIVW